MKKGSLNIGPILAISGLEAFSIFLLNDMGKPLNVITLGQHGIYAQE
jgi:hypothetical protein